jgi:protein ImuA
VVSSIIPSQATMAREPEAASRFSLAPAALHEFYAAADADAPAQVCLALGVAGADKSLLWVRQAFLDREFGGPNPCGLGELGLDPGRITLVSAADAPSALQAGLEGARCAALAAVVVELWGEPAALDLTASRRLALAAKASGVRVMMLRAGARPRPSAAETRWEVRAAPSRALPANAPGNPAFDITLLRSRIGLEGRRHHLEWDRDARTLVVSSAAGHPAADAAIRTAGGSPLSGAVVPLPLDRAGAREAGAHEAGALRRAG